MQGVSNHSAALTRRRTITAPRPHLTPLRTASIATGLPCAMPSSSTGVEAIAHPCSFIASHISSSGSVRSNRQLQCENTMSGPSRPASRKVKIRGAVCHASVNSELNIKTVQHITFHNMGRNKCHRSYLQSASPYRPQSAYRRPWSPIPAASPSAISPLLHRSPTLAWGKPG